MALSPASALASAASDGRVVLELAPEIMAAVRVSACFCPDAIPPSTSRVTPNATAAPPTAIRTRPATKTSDEPSLGTTVPSYPRLPPNLSGGKPVGASAATPTLIVLAPTLTTMSCSMGAFDFSLHAFILYLPGSRCLNR